MKRFLLAALLMTTIVHAAPRSIISIVDPSGDDNGDSRLVYPQQGGYETGDLDLIGIQISRDDEGFWFEPSFRNSIRNPARATGAVGPESLSDTARKGFYQFNLDIYIDTDRIKGSGNTFALPGRQVRIDSAYAWERAVILTPRPEATRTQLLDVLANQYPSRPSREVEASIDQTIFFPTKIRVRGKTVSFLVPAGFFGGSDGTDWAITAFVTAAHRTDELKISLIPSGKTPLQELDLGVMQPQVGRPRDAVGYGTGPKPSPIFDLLSRSSEQQAALLASGAPLTGISWGPHAIDDAAAGGVAARSGAAIQTIAPTEGAEPRSAGRSFLSSPWESLRDLFRGDTTGATATPGAATPVESLLDPAKPEQTRSMAAPAPTTQTIAKRLRTLQQLFDEKMIDEVEYRQQKQRILNEL
jgi:hypothetical protein